MFSKFVNHLIKNLEVLKKFDEELITIFINAIISTKYNNSKIFIYGVGRSGYVGMAFAMRLMHLGFNSHFIGEPTCPAIEDNDLLIVISGSGETCSVVNVLKRANELKMDENKDNNKNNKDNSNNKYNKNNKNNKYNNLKIISITCKKENTVKELSDIHIHLGTHNNKCFPMGTLFEEMAFIFLDGIIYLLMERLNISENEMKKRHCNLQ
ncbi:6-phospho-3-hexuloisomerase [Methanothermococcus okinawensis IH1]|uniref:6-phospho-3-hexuloisomerase n=1 Tax=Methanothermococcus okinawensis (strain DSM 14208 / JCM 11175 / IH1) TaxID=647113 RepID=F8AM27_METOI|nr:6-phospho-3-hexuloisomerase [Methanothermococcus okinawensis IH1]